MSSASRVGRNAAVMAAGTMVSRLLGLVRVSLLAVAIGATTNVANAFDVANRLPNVVFIVIAGGVLNAVLVPQLTKAMRHSDGGQDFTDRLLTLALTATAGLTLVAVMAAPVLVWLYGDGFDPDTQRLATLFALLCLPQVFFYGLYTLLGQVLTSRERFAAFMWAPVLANVVQILGLLAYLALFTREPRVAELSAPALLVLGGSATLGIAIQAGVLIIPLRRIGFHFRPRWGFRGVGLGAASRVAMWSLATVAVAQLGIMVSSRVLSNVPPGNGGLAVYNNAFLIFMLPHGLVTVSLLTAMYPALSRRVHSRDLGAIAADVRRSLLQLLTVVMPVSILLIVLGPAIAALLFPSIPLTDARAMGWMVMALAVGLVPYAGIALFQRVYYAFEDGRKPFVIQLLSTAVVVAIAPATVLLLPWPWVGVGIGVAQTAAQLAGILFSGWLISRRIGGLSISSLTGTIGRLLLASVAAGLAAFATIQSLIPVTGATVLRVGGELGGCPPSAPRCESVPRVADQWGAVLLTSVEGGLVFVGAFLICAVVLKLSPQFGVLDPLVRRLRRR